MTQPESIRLPYHKKYLTLSNRDVKAVLTNRLDQLPATLDRDAESALVRAALDNPIGSSPLEELVRGKHDICIITSDHTRPVPSSVTMPILLERIRTGNPDADITILIATGFHRASTREEQVKRVGYHTHNRLRPRIAQLPGDLQGLRSRLFHLDCLLC